MSATPNLPSAKELLGDIDFLIACLERIQSQKERIRALETLAAEQSEVIASYAALSLSEVK